MNINRWKFEIPLEDVRSEDYHSRAKGENVCLLCGKTISKPHYSVHLLTNGNLISSDAENISNSQGFFTIGAECKNRLPNNFYFITNLF